LAYDALGAQCGKDGTVEVGIAGAEAPLRVPCGAVTPAQVPCLRIQKLPGLVSR